MNPALELLRISGMDERQLGATLALLARGMGGVPAIIADLERSAAAGSQLARNVLAAHAAANTALAGVQAAAQEHNPTAGLAGRALANHESVPGDSRVLSGNSSESGAGGP